MAAAVDDEKREEDGHTHENKRIYKTKYQVHILLAEMEHQICEGKSDEDLIKFFNLRERQFYYYKKKLYEQSLQLQKANKTDEVLAFETRMLKHRLMNVYQHLNQRLIKINNDPTIDDNIADVAAAAFQIAKAIMNLEMEGLRALSTINENKFLKYANRAYNYYNNNNNINTVGNNNNNNDNLLHP